MSFLEKPTRSPGHPLTLVSAWFDLLEHFSRRVSVAVFSAPLRESSVTTPLSSPPRRPVNYTPFPNWHVLPHLLTKACLTLEVSHRTSLFIRTQGSTLPPWQLRRSSWSIPSPMVSLPLAQQCLLLSDGPPVLCTPLIPLERLLSDERKISMCTLPLGASSWTPLPLPTS